MNAPVLQSTLRQMHEILVRPRLWLVFAVVVVLFAVTGPFGTYGQLPFHSRLGYWLAVHAIAFVLAVSFITFFNVLLEGRFGDPLSRMIVGAIVAALPIALNVTCLNTAFLGVALSLAEYADNLLASLPVSLALSVLVWLTLDAEPLTAVTAPQTGASLPLPMPTVEALPAPPHRPALIDRLPHARRGTLIRLEVQDHYVLAVTTRGGEMLLMRLADAIAEAGAATGMQVHRSHWVAFDAVEGLEREPGKTPRLMLAMSDGARVPVSRSHAVAVRARFAKTSPPI